MSEGEDLIMIVDTHEKEDMDDLDFTASDSEHETIVVVDEDNDITSTQSVKRERSDDGSVAGFQQENIFNSSNTSDMDSSSTINSRAPSLQIENPYKRIKFVNETLNDTHKDVRRMLRRDLEDLVKKKLIEVVVYKEELGTMHRKVIKMEASMGLLKKQAQVLSKSLMALKEVQNRFIKDVVASGGTTLVTPVKICRNVGLNVGTCKLSNDSTIENQYGGDATNALVGESKTDELEINEVNKDQCKRDCLNPAEVEASRRLPVKPVINKPIYSSIQRPSTDVSSELELIAGENKSQTFLSPSSQATRRSPNSFSEHPKINATAQFSKSPIQSKGLNSPNEKIDYKVQTPVITRSKAAASKILFSVSESEMSSTKPRSELQSQVSEPKLESKSAGSKQESTGSEPKSNESEPKSNESEPKSTPPEIRLTRASSKCKSIESKITEAMINPKVSEAKSSTYMPTGVTGSVIKSTGAPSKSTGSTNKSSNLDQYETVHAAPKTMIQNMTLSENPGNNSPITPNHKYLNEISVPITPAKLKGLPPAPKLDIKKIETGYTISWNMDLDLSKHEKIISYQIYTYQGKMKSARRFNNNETKLPIPGTDGWKFLATCTSLVPPMAMDINWNNKLSFKHFFAVRAQDEFNRLGPFSTPI